MSTPSIPSSQIKIYYPIPVKKSFNQIPESLPFRVNHAALKESSLLSLAVIPSDREPCLFKVYIDPENPDELVLSRIPSPDGYSGEKSELTFELNSPSFPVRLSYKDKSNSRVYIYP